MITLRVPMVAPPVTTPELTTSPTDVVSAFHHLYYMDRQKSTWQNTHWMGQQIFKCPFDLWTLQEILCEVKPEIITHCGSGLDGTALFLAHMCELLGHGRVLDVHTLPPEGQPRHPRITTLSGLSTADSVVEQVRQAISPGQTVLVILDSDHHLPHVLEELRIYSRIVTPGSYLIVAGTHLNGHPVSPNHGPGPMEAIDQFLKETRNFESDSSREKFMMTFNPRGYLKRLR
jgi:cephalosporin hydroxylase